MEDTENRQDTRWLKEMGELISERGTRRICSGRDEVSHEFIETVADLEKSAAFGERLKTINREIVRQLVTGNTKLEV